MKTLLSLVAAGLLASTSVANASNEDLKDLATVVAKDQKVSLYLNEESGPVKVALLDQRGKVLAKSKVKDYDKDVVLPYNLENLPEGKYSLEIQSADEEMTYDFTTSKAEFQPVAPKMMAYGKTLDPNSLRLTVIGLQEPGVEVTIYDKNSDKVIHSEKIDQPEAFTKIFKFENIKTEDISVDVLDSKGTLRTIQF